MPGLIWHPEHIVFTGFQIKSEMTAQGIILFDRITKATILQIVDSPKKHI